MFKLKFALPLLAICGLAQADTLTIDHAMGRTELDAPAVRVVTLYQGATDAAVALGITPVGVVDSWVEKPMYQYLRDELADVAHVGLETQPNLEEIAALNPDVIIAAKMRHEAVYDQLNQIAPTIAHETVFQFKETLDLVAAATGRTDAAEQWHQNWDARIADFQQQVAELDNIDWPQQVALLNFRNDHARIYYSSFAGNILNELGFERPQAHREDVWGVKLTSKESIPSMNADVFFIFMTETDATVMENYQDWTSHPLWNTLDAVRNEQVYRVDQVDWNMGGGPIAAQRMVDSVFEHYGLE
ncbi:iron ABC transporter substrate-binding protein [Saccharospirillum sp. MSK14-1]|uniref:ABC transporter substrate-binding protein n=1 Tax=Saccharospirillum sp. MSK14-1 TaxID=1897632 RepID=UPI000D3BBFA0|nr:iron-siderophore ABC transporter substrate-binding protein [Saccharospirillum sp. MSK14-1]PTY38701.1 iron ABC transporter substrate-binding protein [Saccharospirillum sp. MSK14-1]